MKVELVMKGKSSVFRIMNNIFVLTLDMIINNYFSDWNLKSELQRKWKFAKNCEIVLCGKSSAFHFDLIFSRKVDYL